MLEEIVTVAENRRRISKQIKKWMPKLRRIYQGWDITYTIEAITGSKDQAQIVYKDTERRAHITFDPYFLKPENVPETTAHEFAHILMRDYDLMVMNTIDDSIAPASSGLIKNLLIGELERVCDHIARTAVDLIKFGSQDGDNPSKKNPGQ